MKKSAWAESGAKRAIESVPSRWRNPATFDISPSAIERFGLFTIIVLGEFVVGVVQGLASHHAFTWQAGGTALLGMLIAIGLWWIYFDFVSHRKPRTTQIAPTGWLYLHLPLTMSITAVGAAVLNIVEHAGETLSGDVRWLLTGAITVAFVTIALLSKAVQYDENLRPVMRTGSMVVLVAGLLIGRLGLSVIRPLPLLLSTIALMLAPIFFRIWLWIKRVLAAEEVANSG